MADDEFELVPVEETGLDPEDDWDLCLLNLFNAVDAVARENGGGRPLIPPWIIKAYDAAREARSRLK